MIFDHQNRWANLAIFGIFFVLFLHAIEDPDIWFHMTIGRAVLELNAIPTQEFYVFTRLGDAAEFHEWGFGLIYELVFKALGVNGIIIFNALIGALTVFILYLIVRNRGSSIAISFSVAIIGFWLMEFRFVERPENFLYLAIVITLYCIDRFHQRADWRYLCGIPFVGLALSQIHPSVILLGLVTGTYLVEAIARKQPDFKRATLLGLTIIATLLLSLLNPYGLEQLILPIKFSLNEEFLQSFTEFFPALSTEFAYRFVIALVLILFSLSGLRKRFSLAEWIMLLAFIYLSYKHVRDIPLLGIALVFPLATALETVKLSTRYQALIAVFLLIIISYDSTRFHNLSFEIDPSMASISGAEIVAQYSNGPNILNFYHLGNYLAWRLYGTHKVIIDGRNYRDNKSLQLHDALLSAVPGWEQVLWRYNIDAVVTPATLPFSGDFIPLAFELIQDSRWVMLNREPAGVVFIRRDRVPQNVAVLPERELWLQAKKELTRTLTAYPDNTSSQKSMKQVMDYLQKH